MAGHVNLICISLSLSLFQEGEHRYNCDDCPESFDLCQLCYTNGDIVQEHLKTFGNLHTFTCETRYSVCLCVCVCVCMRA